MSDEKKNARKIITVNSSKPSTEAEVKKKSPKNTVVLGLSKPAKDIERDGKKLKSRQQCRQEKIRVRFVGQKYLGKNWN